MSGITIGWNNNKPANADLFGTLDDNIRSTKSNLQGALDAEHVWSSVSQLAGHHRAGSARVFYGAKSAVSSSDTDGRMMATSATSRLYYVGSDMSTFRVGMSTGLTARSLSSTQSTVGGRVSRLSRHLISVDSISMATDQHAGVWSFPANSQAIFFVQVDLDSQGTAAPALVTVDNVGSGSGGMPQTVRLWHPDGSTWSGQTMIINLMSISMEAL